MVASPLSGNITCPPKKKTMLVRISDEFMGLLDNNLCNCLISSSKSGPANYDP